MYSNTIYILNNTIIECFDIAFNKKTNKNKTKTKNKPVFLWFVLFQIMKEDATLASSFKTGEWDKLIHTGAILLHTRTTEL